MLATDQSIDVDSLVRFLVKCETATPTRAMIVEGLGLDDPDSLDDLLDLAVTEGAVETWEDSPDGPSVTLSSLTVERLNLELVESRWRYGRFVAHRWARAGTLDRLHRMQLMRQDHESSADDDEAISLESRIPDREPSRDIVPDFADHWRRAAADHLGLKRKNGKRPKVSPVGWYALRFGVLPKPTHILGVDRPWPVPPRADGSCGVCGGRSLPLLAYCLSCERSGLDGAIDPDTKALVERSKRRATTATSRKPAKAGKAGKASVKDQAGLLGGTGRISR